MTLKFIKARKSYFFMIRKLILGIDTGGTHTDAVVFDPVARAVTAAAKAETTHQNLSLGIARALANLSSRKWPGGLAAIERINLSTTLATNAIAEGQNSPVGLIMIGYDPEQASVRGLASDLPLAEVVFVGGGHDYYGREETELDEEAVKAAVTALDPALSGWAVSGLFSVKNPDHEVRTAEIIKSLSSKPVTMGRDLTGQYDAVRRAATAALNAGLVPIINNLLDAVKEAAAQVGLEAARLMVVKGDGTLVSESWAREKPIETVVSGPAASLLGAGVLGRGLMRPAEKNLWVMDIGGTTTDLAYVKDGRPVVNPDGALVGRWQTMTTTVATRTRGLGGDSLVELNHHSGEVSLGPRRVLPLCRLARKYPQVEQTLRTQKVMGLPATLAGVFFLPDQKPDASLSPEESDLAKALTPDQPLPLTVYARERAKTRRRAPALKVIQHPAILISAFTPTDAMCIAGLYNEGSREAAVLGAEIIGRVLKLSAEEVAAKVLDEFGRLMTQELASHSLEQAGIKYDQEEFSTGGVFSQTLGRRELDGLEIGFRASATVFLLGAPAAALAPFLSRYLSGRIIVPPVFDKANAAGAACAPVSLSREAEIHALPGRQGFRLFLPNESHTGWSVEALTEIAEKRMGEHMLELARLAGARRPEVGMTAENRRIILKNGRVLNMGVSLKFTVKDTAE